MRAAQTTTSERQFLTVFWLRGFMQIIILRGFIAPAKNLVMKQPIIQRTRQKLFLFYAVELVCCGLAFAFFAHSMDVMAGVSALFGGLANWLPNVAMACLTFRQPLADRSSVKRLYLGEVVKYVLTIVIFGLAFGLLKASFMPLFVTFVILQFAQWTLPWILNTQQRRVVYER